LALVAVATAAAAAAGAGEVEAEGGLDAMTLFRSASPSFSTTAHKPASRADDSSGVSGGGRLLTSVDRPTRNAWGSVQRSVPPTPDTKTVRIEPAAMSAAMTRVSELPSRRSARARGVSPRESASLTPRKPALAHAATSAGSAFGDSHAAFTAAWSISTDSRVEHSRTTLGNLR
jgi:hypothetical protein